MTPRRKWSIAGMIVGVALLPAPLCGLLGMFAGMTTSFEAVAASESPSPSDLAEGVYLAMAWTAAGIALFVLGLVLFVLSLVRYVTAPREANTR